MDDWISLIPAYFIYAAAGIALLLWADIKFPRATDRVVGGRATGVVVCVLIWPWTLLVILTLAWSDRNKAETDEHETHTI